MPTETEVEADVFCVRLQAQLGPVNNRTSSPLEPMSAYVRRERDYGDKLSINEVNRD